MLRDYIKAALERAHYEIIDDEEPFYGEVPELKGVWATGETLEACRSNLESMAEGWLLIQLSCNLSILESDALTLFTRKSS